MRRLFSLLLILMLAMPAAAAPCDAPPPAAHHAAAAMQHDPAPAKGCCDQSHGCIGCAAQLREPATPVASDPLSPARRWAAWVPARPTGLAAIPATPPPILA